MKARTLLAFALLVGAVGVVPAPAALPGCEADSGSEWRRYGGTQDNSRTQWDAVSIDASNVASVGLGWVFDAQDAGGGSFSNTPVVADGCVYLASSTGWVFALNAQDGAVVWTSGGPLPGNAAGALVGGVITGSPVVANGKVYVAVARSGDPYVAVLDQASGDLLHSWPVLEDEFRGENNQFSNTIIASPVVWNGLIFQGIMAGEADAGARGGWAVLDADTGEILVQDWTIPDNDYEEGYRGASIWCSPAMDEETGFLYACGGNPASKRIEHPNSNALLKFDLNRFEADGVTPNPDFGRLVDSYKGDVDQYYPGLDRQPVCDLFAEDINVVWSQACLQLDLDFGSSPNLFTVEIGGEPVKVVGALQKSGIFHAVYAEHMNRAWTTVVGAPCFPCNASSSAFDENGIYVAAVPPGQVVSLSKEAGRYQWATPIPAGGTHFQPVSTANGVVYGMDNFGFLNAYDASTGLPLMKRNLAQDTGDNAIDTSSQGVAIARDTIFAASGRFVVAYRSAA